MLLGLDKLSLCWATYRTFKSALGALEACKSATFQLQSNPLTSALHLECLFPWC